MRTRLLFSVLFGCACTAALSAQTPAPTQPAAPKPAAASNALPSAAKSAAVPAAKSGAAAAQPKAPEADSAAPAGASPAAPSTTILDPGEQPADNKAKAAGSDPYLDVPPMPAGNVTLVGGMVRKLDHIRARMTVEPFGGKPISVRFDERTHFYRDGIETTQMGVNKGDRVYVDTMLDRTHVFARNIRVVTEAKPADARGQLLGFNESNRWIVVQDELSAQPVRFRIDAATTIKKQGASGSLADLQPGALIAVHFSPEKANRGVAREVTVFAVPGQTFTFAGEITYLNVATGMMAVRNLSDGKAYEIVFDPSTTPDRNDFAVGAQVDVRAQFNGEGYKAQQITLSSARR